MLLTLLDPLSGEEEEAESVFEPEEPEEVTVEVFDTVERVALPLLLLPLLMVELRVDAGVEVRVDVTVVSVFHNVRVIKGERRGEVGRSDHTAEGVCC